MVLSTPEQDAAQALEVKARGIRGYKVHPPASLDIEAYTAVREAVGPDFPLMAYYESDMAAMAADPTTQDWWALCMPLQRPLEDRVEGEWWMDIPEIFHSD